MPRLPGVALREVEARGVRRQPAVGAARPEVELGAEAVQRAAGRRDPARIRVAGVEDGLLGVGAERARDQQRDPVGARGALHAVERARDVRPHALALALGERPVVAAARAGELARRRELRLGLRGRSAPSAARRPCGPRRRRGRVTRTRTGANEAPSGNATRTPRAPFARATRSAAARPSARYSALPTCRAPGRARSAKTGSNSRAYASCIARAPASAPRSAARCAPRLPPTARARRARAPARRARARPARRPRAATPARPPSDRAPCGHHRAALCRLGRERDGSCRHLQPAPARERGGAGAGRGERAADGERNGRFR